WEGSGATSARAGADAGPLPARSSPSDRAGSAGAVGTGLAVSRVSSVPSAIACLADGVQDLRIQLNEISIAGPVSSTVAGRVTVLFTRTKQTLSIVPAILATI